MELMNEYKNIHEGNECWFFNYVILARLDTYLYIVVHTEVISGSWTDNSKKSTSKVFTDYDEASSYMDELIAKV